MDIGSAASKSKIATSKDDIVVLDRTTNILLHSKVTLLSSGPHKPHIMFNLVRNDKSEVGENPPALLHRLHLTTSIAYLIIEPEIAYCRRCLRVISVDVVIRCHFFICRSLLGNDIFNTTVFVLVAVSIDKVIYPTSCWWNIFLQRSIYLASGMDWRKVSQLGSVIWWGWIWNMSLDLKTGEK